MASMEDNKEALKQLEADIMLDETETTYEYVGARVVFVEANLEMLSNLGLDIALGQQVVSHAILGNSEKVFGAYKVEAYINLFKQISDLTQGILKADVGSRQHIVTFPKLHCFQTIQFLVRGSELHVITNMRSCNFKVNFLMDVFISYIAGTMFLAGLKDKKLCNIQQINVIMNIGSLHIFKDRG